MFFLDNDLSGLPGTIKYFKNLEILDITENKYLTNLPVSLCFLKNLKVCIAFISFIFESLF